MDKKQIYDRLCFALTAYEANDDQEHDPEYDFGAALYNDILAIVSDMEMEM